MRRGISQVVTTVIMAGILLTVVGVVVFYATSLIDAHRQAMEFEAGKNLMVYAATALEQVALGAGGAREVRFSLSTTGLTFKNAAFGKLEVRINGQTVLEDYPPAMILVGGPYVSTTFRLLRPEVEVNPEVELDKLVVGAGEPVVVVYENFTGRAIVVLHAARVRAYYLGVYRVAESPGNFVPYNFFEVSYINVTLGQLGGSGHVPVIMRNVGIKVSEYVFNNTNAITIECTLDGKSQTITLTGNPNVENSVVLVRVADVVVSTG